MKLRNHISPVVCLVVALASLWFASVALAQQAFPVTPFMPPVRQSCLSGRFYVQGGVQFRSIQRLGFQKTPSVIRYAQPIEDPNNPGQFYTEGKPPFGPNQSGDFGTGTGVPGYPPRPTGFEPDGPNRSGIWIYDDGYITPNGFYTDADTSASVATLWPYFGSTIVPGLGQYKEDTVSSDGIDLGVFVINNNATQVLNGYPGIYPGQPQGDGFEPSNPPLKTDTYGIRWSRVLNETVYDDSQQGVPSRIWQSPGSEIQNLEYNEQIWCPTVEVGVQATSFFDVFWGLSWYSLDKSLTRSFSSQAQLWRRAYTDSFSFWTDDDNNWIPGPYESTTRPDGANVNQQILPDARGVAGYPNRQFYEVIDGGGAAQLPIVDVRETIFCRTDASIYENRLGVRSWTPLYGMGRFGVTLGPLVNLIYFKASQTTRADFTGGVEHVDVSERFSQGWLVSYGLFTAADIEIDWQNYFLRTNAQYNLSEEKQIHNSPNVWMNLNVSGFSSIIAAGLRF